MPLCRSPELASRRRALFGGLDAGLFGSLDCDAAQPPLGFQLIGLDLLFTERLEPLVLELNQAPSMEIPSEGATVDLRAKRAALAGALAIVGAELRGARDAARAANAFLADENARDADGGLLRAAVDSVVGAAAAEAGATQALRSQGTYVKLAIDTAAMRPLRRAAAPNKRPRQSQNSFAAPRPRERERERKIRAFRVVRARPPEWCLDAQAAFHALSDGSPRQYRFRIPLVFESG